MQKKTLMLGVGALVLLGALLAWAFAPRPLQVEAAGVVQGRFEAGIDEDAKTRLRDRYSISAPLAAVTASVAASVADSGPLASASCGPVRSPGWSARRHIP